MSTIHRLRPSKRANEAMGNDLSETEHSKADRPVSPLGAAVRISAIHAIHCAGRTVASVPAMAAK